MSCIRYKFKTALEYDKVTFDGLQISVSDLREKIMSLKKMNLSDNLTLDIMDAQTKKSETIMINVHVQLYMYVTSQRGGKV